MSPKTKSGKFWTQILSASGIDPEDQYIVRLKSAASDKIAIPETVTVSALATIPYRTLRDNIRTSFTDSNDGSFLQRIIMSALENATEADYADLAQLVIALDFASKPPSTLGKYLPSESKASDMLDVFLTARDSYKKNIRPAVVELTSTHHRAFRAALATFAVIGKRTNDEALDKFNESQTLARIAHQQTFTAGSLPRRFLKNATDWGSLEEPSVFEKTIIEDLGPEFVPTLLKKLPKKQRATYPLATLRAGLNQDELGELYKDNLLPAPVAEAVASSFSMQTLVYYAPAGALSDKELTNAFRARFSDLPVRERPHANLTARLALDHLVKTMADAEVEMMTAVMNTEETLRLSDLLPALG